MKLDKKRLNDMRNSKKTIWFLFMSYLTSLFTVFYSINKAPYYVTIGMLLITVFILILMYTYKEKVLNG